ncbi:hypothetical protein [Hymenobacter cheonanensis]|uniref:hypothetical protein n=1 Tax=Hymenobacter sp. CA2-7 TaxID=3063993 RepID=UPI0027126A82|nr:hypothetical protein [Hymenobacter sp. CA2-7]MDO7883973.1 hypothetical protein [Hymenobacter sp. CA2-7]
MLTPDKSQGSLKSRKTLKSYFVSGSLPTQQNFADLIESMVNRLDDKAELPPQREPLPGPNPGGDEPPANQPTDSVALYQQVPRATSPNWLVGLETGVQPPGLDISEGVEPTTAADLAAAATPGSRPGISRLHLQVGGNVGIGTTAPTAQLEVNGFVASQGRRGTYADAQCPGTEVPADGQWHPILRGLDGLHAFEIVAAAYGPAGRGRYALTQATALSAYGKSQSRVYRRDAWFWGWFQKIQFRWTGALHDYGLDMRTASSFGPDARIVYHITHLFDDRRPQGPPSPGA